MFSAVESLSHPRLTNFLSFSSSLSYTLPVIVFAAIPDMFHRKLPNFSTSIAKGSERSLLLFDKERFKNKSESTATPGGRSSMGAGRVSWGRG